MLKWFWKLRRALLARLGAFGSAHYLTGGPSLPAPLSPEAEKALLAQMAAGDRAARDELICHNLRLVVYLSKKYESSGVPPEDLVSIGTIGLIKAVNTFTPERNIKLALGTDENQVGQRLEQDAERAVLRRSVERLSARERQIMELRFGLVDGVEHTQKEAADAIGISQSYISRLEKRIIRDLRKELEQE